MPKRRSVRRRRRTPPPKKKAASAAAAGPSSYSAADIEVLEGLEPVRRRPGMYIGGTDNNALHHLFAEVIDNSMDEAIAGHASRIEVHFGADGYLTVTDNGRGIPVENHPKFPGRSTLEIVMTTLHAGGKFDGKAYETSGGLHGVGVSVVNALSDELITEVARDQVLYRQTYSRGKPTSKVIKVGPVQNRRGTSQRFHPDPEIFGGKAEFSVVRLFKMTRAKAYLFGGVEIRWSCDESLATDEVPAKATFHFPGGLREFLAARIEGEQRIVDDIFSGQSGKPGSHGAVEWAISWNLADGFVQSYCNTIPTAEGGTHEQGLRTALLRGLRAYAELKGDKRAANLTVEDVLVQCSAMLSVFVREPEFVGQTKDRLSSPRSHPHRRHGAARRLRPLADRLAAAGQQAARLGRRARRRAAAPQEGKGDRPAVGDAKAPPAGQARRLHAIGGAGRRNLHRRGRLGRRQRQIGARPRQPGRAAAARQGAQRRRRDARQDHRQPADRRPDPGAGLRHARPLPRGRSALRQDHPDDRRRRRRRPHRLAADDLLLPGNAQAHRRRAPLPRHAAALPHQLRAQGALRDERRCTRTS